MKYENVFLGEAKLGYTRNICIDLDILAKAFFTCRIVVIVNDLYKLLSMKFDLLVSKSPFSKLNKANSIIVTNFKM